MGFSIISLWEVIYYFTVRPWCRHKEDRFSKTQNQSTSDSTKNGYLDQNGKEHNHAEARRVNMKPGDDGKFHLQSKRSSPPPLYKNCCNHDCNNQQVDNSLPKLQEDDNSQLWKWLEWPNAPVFILSTWTTFKILPQAHKDSFVSRLIKLLPNTRSWYC